MMKQRHAAGAILIALVPGMVGMEAPALGATRTEPVATFSIVARDPATGDLAIAVESRFFAVGAVVPWARAGVGAVATQAAANTTFGPRGLELLASGLAPEQVLASLLGPDPEGEQRQIGIVDAEGRSAAATGPQCQAWAGHRTGPDYAIQGNILTGEEVVKAMERAFLATEGHLGSRLLSALEAGQAAGGDSRGQQSAALLIVREKGGYRAFNDRYCDLRVDDHETPIAELRRLYTLWLPNALILEGYNLVAEGKFDVAIARGEEAIAFAPESGEGYYHTACYLARAGRGDEALQRLGEAIARDPQLAQQAAGDPDFESIRALSRFQELTSGTTPAAPAGNR